jgi:hypothetical protein
MDLNSNTEVNNTSTESKKLNKNFLLIKFPANIQNPAKAIECLGGKETIVSKVNINFFTQNNTDEDLEIKNIFIKSIPLEKCISNDILIKRKRYRNKKR